MAALMKVETRLNHDYLKRKLEELGLLVEHAHPDHPDPLVRRWVGVRQGCREVWWDGTKPITEIVLRRWIGERTDTTTTILPIVVDMTHVLMARMIHAFVTHREVWE